MAYWEKEKSGNYLLSGSTRPKGHPEGNAFIAQLNEQGNILRMKDFGTPDTDIAQFVAEDTDDAQSTFTVFGTTVSDAGPMSGFGAMSPKGRSSGSRPAGKSTRIAVW